MHALSSGRSTHTHTTCRAGHGTHHRRDGLELVEGVVRGELRGHALLLLLLLLLHRRRPARGLRGAGPRPSRGMVHRQARSVVVGVVVVVVAGGGEGAGGGGGGTPARRARAEVGRNAAAGVGGRGGQAVRVFLDDGVGDGEAWSGCSVGWCGVG